MALNQRAGGTQGRTNNNAENSAGNPKILNNRGIGSINIDTIHHIHQGTQSNGAGTNDDTRHHQQHKHP